MIRSLIIADRTITQDSDAFVVAEIGHNHGGNLATALQMCKVAKECGCDAVKFQKRTNRKLFTKAAYNAPYHSEHAFGKTYGEHREALEFGYTEYMELMAYCREELGIICFATAFDQDAADFLEELNVPAYKIASGDLTNLPLIDHCAAKGKPLIISTGGGNWQDIGRANAILYSHIADGSFLHCVAIYPTPPEKVNLGAIDRMMYTTPDRIIGYSCHYNGPMMAVLSYFYGARIIEKHFTLDHTAKGSDHALSLQPEGMRKMVRDLRRARVATGSREKTRNEEEEKALSKMAKSVYPQRTLPPGHTISEADIAAKTPTTQDGLRPYRIKDILGKSLIFEATTSGPLTQDDIDWE